MNVPTFSGLGFSNLDVRILTVRANPHFCIIGVIPVYDLKINDNKSGSYFSEYAAATTAYSIVGHIYLQVCFRKLSPSAPNPMGSKNDCAIRPSADSTNKVWWNN